MPRWWVRSFKSGFEGRLLGPERLSVLLLQISLPLWTGGYGLWRSSPRTCHGASLSRADCNAGYRRESRGYLN